MNNQKKVTARSSSNSYWNSSLFYRDLVAMASLQLIVFVLDTIFWTGPAYYEICILNFLPEWFARSLFISYPVIVFMVVGEFFKTNHWNKPLYASMVVLHVFLAIWVMGLLVMITFYVN